MNGFALGNNNVGVVAQVAPANHVSLCYLDAVYCNHKELSSWSWRQGSTSHLVHLVVVKTGPSYSLLTFTVDQKF